jgi:ribosomal protein L30/L7E
MIDKSSPDRVLKVTQVKSGIARQAEDARHAACARPRAHRQDQHAPDRPEIRGMLAARPPSGPVNDTAAADDSTGNSTGKE